MNDLKNYTVNLLRARIINFTGYAEEREGVWVLTKPFAGIQADTAFQNEGEMFDRIANALVTQASRGDLRSAA